MYIVINTVRFNKFVNKHGDIDNIVKIPRDFKSKDMLTVSHVDKTHKLKRDGLYANKNKRSMNKDYKDFMNGL